MKYEGVSYNVNSYRRQIEAGLTKQQFITRGIAEGKYRQYGLNQVRMLEEAWRLLGGQ